jgi:excisionase family DNA binding protein
VDREAREEVALRRRAATLGDVLRRLARGERLLRELLDRDLGAAAPGLLSKREAARRLGIDRGTTLEDLVRTGRLRTVLALTGKGIRVPSAEVARLLREGLPPVVAPPAAANRRRACAKKPVSGDELERAIRSIPIPARRDED